MIHSFEYCKKHIGVVGEVSQVNEFLLTVRGLTGAKVGEGVTLENELHGRIMSTTLEDARVLLLSREEISPGTKVARTGDPLSISVGEGLLGHMIDTLGHSLTNRRQKSHTPEKRAIESHPSGIAGRRRISSFFETGIAINDILIPLGSGQRELVIGDRKTGKTHYLLQVMATQAKMGTICIYTAIGKSKSEVKLVDEFLDKTGILDKSIIVAADSYASPGEVYLAPYTAMTLAEYFRDLGQNVLVIFDDLTSHAKYYREIGLLAEQLPGREAYPADIFHIQAKLIERAGAFAHDEITTTITCLPVAETVGGDLSGYIQTNLMSVTDGHVYFDSEEYFAGRRPPINIFLSVTRVGRQTQPALLQDIGVQLTKLLKQYDDTKQFLRFEAELSETAQQTLSRGGNLLHFFDQIGDFLIPTPVQSLIVALIWLGWYDKEKTETIVSDYTKKASFKTSLDHLVKRAKTFDDFINLISTDHEEYKNYR